MPAQSAAELREEFAAISDFIESGERPSAKDRNNAIALWGKMVAKLNQGPIPAKTKFEQTRRTGAAGLSFLDKDGKHIMLARFEQELDQIMEEREPGCLKTYVSAVSCIEEFDRCIQFLEFWLSSTAPVPAHQTIGSMPAKAIEAIVDKPAKEEETAVNAAPKKPRAKRIKVPEPAAETQDAAAGKHEDADEGNKDTSEAAPADASAPAEAVDEAPKSSFQKILEKAGK